MAVCLLAGRITAAHAQNARPREGRRKSMSEHNMQSLMDILPFGVGYCKLLFNREQEPVDYMFLDINPAFEKLTGLRREDLLDKPAAAYFSGREAARLYDLSFFTEVVRSGKPREITRWMGEEHRYLVLLVTPVEGDCFSIVIREAGMEAPAPVEPVQSALSEPVQEAEEPPCLTCRDALTGLYNRRYIEQSLPELSIPQNLPLCIVIGDVNGLKITNDLYGREAGDTLLRHVARELARFCKPGDVAARWAGGEFVIFLPRSGPSRVESIMNRLKTASVTIAGQDMPVSISFGWASRENEDVSVEDALSEAEAAMYNEKLLEEQSGRNAITSTLLAALYEKSSETEAHSKRIERYCHAIGRELQLSSREMNELSLFALLHDIGKVSIDRAILQKPGPLTKAEWAEIKRHPEVGCRIVQNIPELASVAGLILSHHERWDGTGYPNGLVGEDIPLPCRILALADTFDIMTNPNAYRPKPVSREEAILELERNAGLQFDPDIAGIFLWLLRTGQETK